MSNLLLAGLPPVHPGDFLREIVIPAAQQERKLTKSAIAKALGISRQTLYSILNAKEPVTPRIAVRLGHFFGNSPEMWAGMQLHHDLWAETRAQDLSDMPTLEDVA